MIKRIANAWMQIRYRQIALELAVAVCLACLVWLYIHNRARSAIDRVAVPVQVQVAGPQRDQYSVEVPPSRLVYASFTGPYSRIRDIRRKLQRGALKANLTLTIPEQQLAEPTFTTTLHVDEEAFGVPVGVKVEVADDSIPVTVHRLAERTLPVKLECTGDARVAEISIEPASVLVRGPKAVLDRASFVPTQPYAVQVSADAPARADAEVRDQVALVTELDGRPIQTNPATVQFRLKAAPKQKIHELANVPIHFLSPKNSPWRPRFATDKDGKVTLKLIGPATDQAPPVLAFVDLTSGNLARGRNLEPLRLQLPKDFQLVQPATPLVAFYLDEIDRPMP
jgi:hypothetical protein